MSESSCRATASLGPQGCAAMDGYWLFRKDTGSCLLCERAVGMRAALPQGG